MTQQKKWIWPAVGLAVAAAVAGYTIRARDADIQTEREASAQLISTYEQKVQKADQELRSLEAQKIALNDLTMIAKLQAKALNTAKRLIDLAPMINYPNKVDRYSKASVDTFNNGLTEYNVNIKVYQTQMADLNSIVNRANKQYVIKAVQPSFLDRSSLKFPPQICRNHRACPNAGAGSIRPDRSHQPGDRRAIQEAGSYSQRLEQSSSADQHHQSRGQRAA